MVGRRRDQGAETGQEDYTLDQDGLQPEMPRFDSFFESQSQNVHPFEKIKNSFDDSELFDEDQKAFEDERDRELHKKEILGRLIGQNLTPRQYELLVGIDSTGEIKAKRMLDYQKNPFVSNRDWIRLTEEKYEKIMRQKVASGEWKESE